MSGKTRNWREKSGVSAMAEIASQIADGLVLLARSMCAVAVERHAKDAKHHEEIAADMWEQVIADFREGDISSATTTMLGKCFRIDPKNWQR